MAIPKFKDLFTDVLDVLSDGQIHHRKELREAVLARLDLTDAERSETMAGGGNRVGSRIHWACEYLAQAGALIRPKRGYMQISDLGQTLLKSNIHGVTLDMLQETEGLQAWRERSLAGREARRNDNQETAPRQNIVDLENDEAPLESIDQAIKLMNSALEGDLLQRIRDEKPEFLERLVLKLLHAMGYGASLENLEHIGGPGDEGVDGVIHQDQLGIDKIYIQAKRYKETGPIGRPQIQSFVGALSGKKATRGVFITTSRFSADALDYANSLTGFSVVLIDGEHLVKFMLENRVGVVVQQNFEVLELDENFFGEDQM
jgi:restriction system protein